MVVSVRALQAVALAAALMASAEAQAPAAPPAAAPAKPARVQPPARIADFRAEPASVKPGQSTTLIWATENPNSVTIDPVIGRATPRGSRPITPSATTTYTLTVTGPGNTTLTKEVTVTVAGTTPVAKGAAVEVAKALPRMPDGKADLSGVYDFSAPRGAAPAAGAAPAGGRGGRGGGGAAAGGPELKPGAEKYRVTRGPTDAGPTSNCMPLAGPAAFTVPYQFQIIQSANYVVIFYEYPGTFRIIPTNNAAHPVDPDPTWLGDSIGKWEGDTLVVDTIGFNDRTELSGYKHSEGLHIVERFSRPTYDALQYEATLEDPNVFVKPWTVSRAFAFRPELTKIDEFVCENNPDYSGLFEKKK